MVFLDGLLQSTKVRLLPLLIFTFVLPCYLVTPLLRSGAENDYNASLVRYPVLHSYELCNRILVWRSQGCLSCRGVSEESELFDV